MTSFDFEISQKSEPTSPASHVSLKDLPIIEQKSHYQVDSQETCLGLHGFFDIEERSCITVHRLVKVCLKVKLDEQTG